MSIELTDEETLRYNRQIVLRGFDFDGQEALKSASVLIVGVGGLGCSVSQYLTAAGVGKLTLLDFDTVSLSNLQRQILHRDSTIGQPKVLSAKTTLNAINPHVQIDTVDALLEDKALAELISQHHLVMDCTDNVTIREQLNRLCFVQKKSLVSGAAIRMEGQISVFTYQDDEPCYRCLSHLFGDNALTCVEAGIMAPVVGTIGTLQAIEAIKLLTGYGETLHGKVLIFDAMRMQFREFKLPKNPHCDVCAANLPDN
ncbi:molybdopterin-synthase adenylyltransferase MoeB [Proteus mirabilis]|uniref:molybdopterin-synthase adenylyltransferase MoeB n=1 Tax=Proteus mirabilis TaxID=584 RepID=UPI001B97578A|nr:molybdopterin-synthase adenylyltransferase MoeB [Proteus mirabilis]MDC5887052.1 molybdopterin-synthase adenylyltransferase MoeB [Proteus mirabilis]MDC5904649.1 molybdopterin-synthase adenylyltransferase MoeB [Proteus mirabilis]MDC5908196.1 molybdopterin-synthase adenylyltransferase MoeB [Proteus mirabilis]MDC5922304.1 molybdopterin-synthase adenylyltransferase MoeB [Proteus mirabilis]MDC5932831.1 molybdopterin-synthase adenylyltransferase MoeB [Proteus mirabilis]